MENGGIGRLTTFNGDISFLAREDPKDRVFNRTLGGGAVLDVGVYMLQYAVMVRPDEDVSLLPIRHS
jgi:predicted dehydrogenase